MFTSASQYPAVQAVEVVQEAVEVQVVLEALEVVVEVVEVQVVLGVGQVVVEAVEEVVVAQEALVGQVGEEVVHHHQRQHRPQAPLVLVALATGKP